MEKQEQTFERVHVGVVKQLLEISRKIQAKRFVHVSVKCARPDPVHAYHDTKYRAEEMIKGSGVPYTILRPSVVYGKGDDMISSLVGVIRTSPLFPLMGSGTSLHQPIMVTDLATCIVECLNSENTTGKIYEIVGPTKVTIKDMVNIVADGMGLPTWSFPFPLVFHSIAAQWGSKVLPNPPATPSQLTMLVEGMTGDSSQIRHDLNLHTLCNSVLSPVAVQQFENQIPPIAGFSLRLFSSQAHYAWVESYLPLFSKSLILSLLSILSGLASFAFEPVKGIFLYYLFISVALIIIMKPHAKWRIEMVQPPPSNVRLYHAALGLSFALFLCFFVKIFVPLSISDWSVPAQNFRKFSNLIFVLFFAIPTDEILWNAACLLPFLARAVSPKRNLLDEDNAAVNRKLGYSVVLAFSVFYGIWMSLLLRVSLFAPNYGVILIGLVGCAACVLVVKTEKLVAGAVLKAIVWFVMVFWME